MHWQAAVLVVSALPEVFVTFKNSEDADKLGLPDTFRTTLEHDWQTFNCSKTISKSGDVICRRKPMICLPSISERALLMDDFVEKEERHDLTQAVPTPVPIKIV